MTAETSGKADCQSTEYEQGKTVIIIKGQYNTEKKTLSIHKPHHSAS